MDDDARPTRLGRTQTREQTRQRLLDAAAHIFARKGYAGASVEEIAEAAGFSIGAVYSNFAGKEDLFSALMIDRTSGHMSRVADILHDTSSSTPDPLTRLGAMLIEIADKDIDIAALEMEFWLHAVRQPRLLDIEATNTAVTLHAIRDILADVLRDCDVDPSVTADEFAVTTLALFVGLIQQRRIDPSRVSEETFGRALGWQIDGMPKKTQGE